MRPITSVPSSAASHGPLQAGDRLDVVVQDVWPRLDHLRMSAGAPFRSLISTSMPVDRVLEADLADRPATIVAPPVGEIVTSDHRDHPCSGP